MPARPPAPHVAAAIARSSAPAAAQAKAVEPRKLAPHVAAAIGSGGAGQAKRPAPMPAGAPHLPARAAAARQPVVAPGKPAKPPVSGLPAVQPMQVLARGRASSRSLSKVFKREKSTHHRLAEEAELLAEQAKGRPLEPEEIIQIDQDIARQVDQAGKYHADKHSALKPLAYHQSILAGKKGKGAQSYYLDPYQEAKAILDSRKAYDFQFPGDDNNQTVNIWFDSGAGVGEGLLPGNPDPFPTSGFSFYRAWEAGHDITRFPVISSLPGKDPNLVYYEYFDQSGKWVSIAVPRVQVGLK